MKKYFEAPQMTVIPVACEDVISTSVDLASFDDDQMLHWHRF